MPAEADGQPFYLSLLSQGLRLLEDPDWEILTSLNDGFEVGDPVGYKSPLPRTPEVFPPKKKQRTLDESQYQEEARNCKSAIEHADKLDFVKMSWRGDCFPLHWGKEVPQ